MLVIRGAYMRGGLYSGFYSMLLSLVLKGLSLGPRPKLRIFLLFSCRENLSKSAVSYSWDAQTLCRILENLCDI